MIESLSTAAQLRGWSAAQGRHRGETVALVPTMGALHEGHRSLVRRAREDCDHVVVSIFVNPAQFENRDDLARYPRSLDADLALLEECGVDAVFSPAVDSVYLAEAATKVVVGGIVTAGFEATLRPGHFEGVALVVTKLIAAASPDRVYFGQKDAQQCALVRRLILDLDLGSELVICPVVRDHDGLALSSRNVHLDAGARAQALAIPRGLAAAAGLFERGETDAKRLLAAVRSQLDLARSLQVDYIAVVDPESFAPLPQASLKSQIVVAANISGTHLIDVLSLGVDGPPITEGPAEKAGEASGVTDV